MAPGHTPEAGHIGQRLKHFNGMLIFVMLYMSFCAFQFGFDVGLFAGVQGMQSFTSKFGKYNEATGLYALPAWLSSVMTATPFLGKAIGCICCGWIAERWGRRAAIFSLCMVGYVGVILQTSASSAAQFTVGRIITFAMTGMTIVVVPIYQAEAAPKVLRGMFASTLQVVIIFGTVVSTLVTYGTQHIKDDRGWRLPVGLQLLMPTIILCLLPILPESPRWLLSQDRREHAVKSLTKLRKKASEEDVELEIEAITYAHANEHKGSWAEVFNKQNRTRTMVAVLVMFGQQITGQAFPTQYGVVFYQSQGFGSQAFIFNVATNVLALGAVVFTWFYVDGIGRRPVLLVGGFLMGAFLFILGAIGSLDQATLNQSERNLMVASLFLFQFSYNLSWAPISYVVVSEAAALRVKEKTNLFASVISVLTTFATSFTIPYLINAQYANLGAKVGYIYGSLNFMMVILTFFLVPELKGRTLEEVDQLFASGAPLRKFSKVETKTAEEIYKDEVNHVTDLGTKKEEAASV